MAVRKEISLLKVAVVNPTSLANNASKFKTLDFDLCFVSESSATKSVKQQYEKNYKKLGMHFTWGCDVPSLTLCRDASESRRGSALGVCMISRSTVTLRPTRDKLPEHWDRTCRIMVSYMQLPAFTVRLVCLYGVQPSAHDAFVKNNSLWQAVLQIVSSCDMPTLIAGDFNMRPQKAQLWHCFQEMGFQEVFEQHELHGVPLPPTCNSKTRHDSIVFSKHFISSFQGAEINQDKLFPNHDPMIASFQVAKASFVYRNLPMPTPLQADVLDSDVFQHCQEKAFDLQMIHPLQTMSPELSHEIFTKNLETIGYAYEKSYQQAVDLHNEFLCIKGDSCECERSCFQSVSQEIGGRLKPRAPKIFRPRKSPKKGRHGVYEPPGETYSLRISQWVKQVRRLQAYLIRGRKYQNQCMHESAMIQHQKEWQVILVADGFKPSFSQWVLFELDSPICYLHEPPLEWVQEIYELLKEKIADLIQKERKCQKKIFQFEIDLSCNYFGGALCHALLKSKSQSVLHCFEVLHKQQGSRIRSLTKSAPQIHVENAKLLQLKNPLFIEPHGCEVAITSICTDEIVEIDQLPSKIGASFTITQKQFCSDPEMIQKAFFEFWAPFWLRDDSYHMESPDAWQNFLEMIKFCPNLCETDISYDHSVYEWIEAISTTKTHTSRGVCGLSQPEMKAMHSKGIQLLIDCCQSVEHCGFPGWLMIAKVILLPKFEGATQIKDMRPITVFSLLYRTWCKVVAKRLLQNWSATIPQCVVGALPKRSCSQLSLQNAILIEKELKIGCGNVGGFYLDICKCFNGFGRLPVVTFMQNCGFPIRFASFWKKSLDKMSRSLFALQTFSSPVGASTGLPEGDPLSVCGMAVIGYGWAKLMECLQLIVSVYVDDWSWIGTCPRQHVIAIRMTQEYLKALKLHADPSKIWVWGSSKEARKQWEDISLQITGTPNAFRVATAEKELGIYLHYTRQNSIGCQLNRINAGLERIKRLKYLSVSIQQKASLLQTNIWPATLHGSDATYIGQKHFDKLRSSATDSMITKTRFTNCLLPLCVLHHGLMDPLVYVITYSLCLWRRMMITDDANGDLFVHVLSTAQADPCRAYGPATAICSYLKHIEWKFNQNGELIDHLGVTVSLTKVSRSTIINLVREAWNCVVCKSLERRNEFHNWPVPLCQNTFDDRNFPDSRSAAIIAIHQCLGQLYGSNCEKWVGGDEDATHQCPLCGGVDNRAHFLLECPALQSKRDSNCRLLERMKTEFPHHLFLPLIYKSPYHDVVNIINRARDLPEVFPSFIDGFCINKDRIFYTDGSCTFPNIPHGRLAGFAIVVDVAEGDIMRCAEAFRSDGVTQYPETLKPLCAGLQFGEQTINRSELTAIIQIIRSTDSAIIVTDSSYTLNVFSQVQKDFRFVNYHGCENYDLILMLCLCFQEGKDPTAFQVKKIASHQEFDGITSLLDKYAILGNRLADLMAKKTTQENRSNFHRASWSLGKTYGRQQQILRQYLRLLVEVDILRQEAKSKQKEKVTSSRAYTDDLEVWQPDALPQQIVVNQTEEFLSGFLPGANVMIAMIRWAQMLQWPQEESSACLGISHVELVINFLVVTAQPLPVILQRVGKFSEYRDPILFPEAALLPHNIWDDVRILEHFITYVRKFAKVDVFPKQVHAKRRYLGIYGCSKAIQGYRWRPILPMQALHVDLMKRLVDGDTIHCAEKFDDVGIFSRERHFLDDLSHQERYRVFRRLEKRLS